ncbi:MAG TPA: tRNA pseudouridine(38-40) synthase TruA [Nitrospirota bacterium]|nr:tRNA pseudouridine(38-40) synthase TruA [Nitrospirota bacterium]
MKNIKLILEYDGTNYHGWQSQAAPGRDILTIQGTLERALKTLSGEDVKTCSSGRTDAGVHALGHAANFKTASGIPPKAWAPALNHLLPRDIRVLESREVPPDFHSRYSALAKTYRYRILNRRAPTALYRNHAWHVNLPLNVARMKRAVTFLVGKHDFSAFRGSGCSAKTPVRTMKSALIRKTGEFIEISLEADAFLQYMVRNITGTLVEVGLGRFTPEDVQRMLASRDRTLSGRTAPPQGLFLVDVSYS